MNVQHRVLYPVKTLLQLEYFHVLTQALLQIVHQVHVLMHTDHHEEYFVLLVHQDVTVVEVLNLFRGGAVMHDNFFAVFVLSKCLVVW